MRKGDNGLRYSDPEKTVLDFIYIWRYNGVPEEKIISDISDWAKKISKERLRKYAREYPTTVAKTVKRVIE